MVSGALLVTAIMYSLLKAVKNTIVVKAAFELQGSRVFGKCCNIKPLKIETKYNVSLL